VRVFEPPVKTEQQQWGCVLRVHSRSTAPGRPRQLVRLFGRRPGTAADTSVATRFAGRHMRDDDQSTAVGALAANPAVQCRYSGGLQLTHASHRWTYNVLPPGSIDSADRRRSQGTGLETPFASVPKYLIDLRETIHRRRARAEPDRRAGVRVAHIFRVSSQPDELGFVPRRKLGASSSSHRTAQRCTVVNSIGRRRNAGCRRYWRLKAGVQRMEGWV
jgi:hypothetical protein